MIDLETMGTTPGSAIVSLGAVVFDPVSGTLGEAFYQVISLESCLKAGLTTEAGTILWWMQQSEAARAQFSLPSAKPLFNTLEDFRAWWQYQGGQFIWGHGANFDEPLLASAYRAIGSTPPWKFWDARCTRTIFGLTGERPDRAKGTHHNALDDAKAQAEAVVRAYRKLRVAV